MLFAVLDPQGMNNNHNRRVLAFTTPFIGIEFSAAFFRVDSDGARQLMMLVPDAPAEFPLVVVADEDDEKGALRKWTRPDDDELNKILAILTGNDPSTSDTGSGQDGNASAGSAATGARAKIADS